MPIIFDIVFALFTVAYLPYLIFTRRYRYGMLMRFGFLPRDVMKLRANGKEVIWIHGVSVGEIKIASMLAPFLRREFPGHNILFSTVTYTGNRVARTIATGEEAVIYLPLDISWITNKLARILRPDMFLCLETELWPNIILSLCRYETRIILVNGRISDRSYKGYRMARFIISGLLKRFDLLLMQSARDAERIINLGAEKERVFVTGNLKFDLLLPDIGYQRKEIRRQLGVNEGEIFLIAGSTHRGEEQILFDVYRRLKNDGFKLRLMVAPRHIERVEEIENILKKDGLVSLRFSEVLSGKRRAVENGVFLLDTMGNLKTLYPAADIVFVGKSLNRKGGGQNPIEPAASGRPILMGPFTSNFRDVVKEFVENDACLIVRGPDKLYERLRFLIKNPHERKRLGIRARETVIKNKGSVEKTIRLIKEAINLSGCK